MSRRGHALALAPVLAAGVALTLVGLRAPDSGLELAAPATRPVDERTLTCFGLPGAPVPRSLAAGPGRVEAPGIDPGLDTGVGGWDVTTLPPENRGEVDVAATGSAAPSVTAVSALRAPPTAGAGLAIQQCAEPARRWWFVGAGSGTVRDGAILLRAPAGVDAVVDVLLRGPDGVLDAVGTDDLRVGAGETVAVRLSRVVAGTDDVAVEVIASQGRVVAALADTGGGGVEPQGTEWLPASAEPATTVLVPGVEGPAVLVVANVTDASVVARPTLMTSSGRAVAADAESVQVSAGGVATVELPGSVRPGTTVEVRADGAVAVAVRTQTRADVALPTGAADLAGPTVVPLDVGAAARDPALVVAAELVDPDEQEVRSRTVKVAGFNESGKPVGSGRLRVDAGTSVAVDLGDVLGLAPADLAELAYAVLDPAERSAAAVPVVASLELTGPGGSSVLPLRSPVTTVTVPALVPRVVPPTG